MREDEFLFWWMNQIIALFEDEIKGCLLDTRQDKPKSHHGNGCQAEVNCVSWFAIQLHSMSAHFKSEGLGTV